MLKRRTKSQHYPPPVFTRPLIAIFLKQGKHYAKALPPCKLYIIYVDVIGPVTVVGQVDPDSPDVLAHLDGRVLQVRGVIPMVDKSARVVTEGLTSDHGPDQCVWRRWRPL